MKELKKSKLPLPTNSRGNFNGKALEKYNKAALIDIICWLDGEYKKQVREMEDDMKYIHSVSGMHIGG